MGDSITDRLWFALHLLRQRFPRQSTACPNCDAAETEQISSKRLLMQLRGCARCGLYFRWPKDGDEWTRRFYSAQYHEQDVTALPDPIALHRMLDASFAGTGYEFSRYLRCVQEFRRGGRLLDFGASWGYGSWQLARAGYDVTGYELDARRAAFGRSELGLAMVDGCQGLSALGAGAFEVVFTAHTLEHLSSPGGAFELFRRVLCSGGWLVLVVPNCTGIEDAEVLRRKSSFAYGRKHLLALSADFFRRNLPKHGFELERLTTQLDRLDARSEDVRVEDFELLVAARRT